MDCTRRRLERPVADRDAGHQRRDQQEYCVITRRQVDDAGAFSIICIALRPPGPSGATQTFSSALKVMCCTPDSTAASACCLPSSISCVSGGAMGGVTRNTPCEPRNAFTSSPLCSTSSGTVMSSAPRRARLCASGASTRRVRARTR
jgi:hypothetical protein